MALLFLLAGALVLLDTAPGHRFIVDRIQGFETASGLKIRIGRIDGSIFGKSQLKNVARIRPARRLPDLANIKLDWAPGAWLNNKLSIDSVDGRAGLAYPPAGIKPSTQERPDPPRLRHPRWRASGSIGSMLPQR